MKDLNQSGFFVVLAFVLIGLLSAAIFIMGCTEEQMPLPPEQDISVISQTNAKIGTLGGVITKYYDKEENVICYIYSDYERGGISCVRMDGINKHI